MLFLLTDSLVHVDKNLHTSSQRFFFSYFNTKIGNICLIGINILVRECLNIQIVVSNPGGDMNVRPLLSVLRSFVWRLSWTDSPSMTYPKTERPDCFGVNSSSERAC